MAAGKLRWYGSSVSDPAIVRAMAEGPHMVAAQHELNVLRGELETLSVAEELGLASLNRTPLAMGLLSGRYRPDALPAADDVRRNAPWWDFFDEGAMERWLERIAEVRAELTADGRSLVQGALGLDLGPQPGDAPAPRIPHRRPGARRTSAPPSTGRFPPSAWSASGRSWGSRCRRDAHAAVGSASAGAPSGRDGPGPRSRLGSRSARSAAWP